MSILDRRVQILVAPAQYEQIERDAERTGQSVAAVIRSAISARLAFGRAAGSLELNVMLPVIARNLLEQLDKVLDVLSMTRPAG